MYRRLFALTFAGLALGGCVQMTRHSNTMVFGTNTSFGISVGSDATSTPSVSIGYKRQEAVIMPLVANTSEAGGVLKPCAQPTNGGALPPSCLLMGQGGASDGRSMDTYSVLASFGAKFAASSSNPNANGQIAQYFATGLAARALAQNGGSSVIATGDAARQNSRSLESSNMARLRASPEIQDRVAADRAQITQSRKTTATWIAGAGANLAERLSAIDTAVGGSDFRDACKDITDAAACSNQIFLNDGLDGLTAKEWADAAAAAK